MACCQICDKMMECFTNGYQALTDLESKKTLSYNKIKRDLDHLSSEWEELEKETKSKIKETVEYFDQFTYTEPDERKVEKIKEKAELLKEDFQDLYARHTEMKGRAGVDPKLVEERHQYSMTMKDKIVRHGRNAWVAAALLGMCLGGLIAWASWKDQILPKLLGVLIGGGAVLIIGGLAYCIFTTVAARGVRKWDALRKRAWQLQQMDKIIDKKLQELYPIPNVLLSMIIAEASKQSVKQVSIKLVKQCQKYDSATP